MNPSESNRFQAWMVDTRHYWIEFLRIIVGTLMIYKGYYFIENIEQIYEMIGETTVFSPYITAHYVVFAHLAGGVLLLIGLLTRLAAVVQIPVLLGAIFVVQGQSMFFGESTNMEYTVLVLVLLIVFSFYGGGKWSLDYSIYYRKSGESVHKSLQDTVA